MASELFLCALCSGLVVAASAGLGSVHPKLLVVSFDGFRHDYLRLQLTPVLSRLRTQGVTTDSLGNVFPTQTFPNHFSIATGLYPEVHGVLGSSVFDPVHRILRNYSHLWSYNPDVMPFWALNEAAGDRRYSGTMMWPGGEMPYGGRKPTFFEPWIEDVPWQTRVDRVISWFLHPRTPANVVFLYFEDPDARSHAYGPNSPEVRAQIVRADGVAGYLMEKLEKNNLNDVNVVFLSDHGLMGVHQKNIINVESVCQGKCQIYGTSPFRQVLTAPSDVNEVYENLNKFAQINKHFQVYKKSEIPENWHIKNCQLTLPIVLVAKPGYAFEDLYKSIAWYKKTYPHITDSQEFGVHGYDPSESTMRGFFIAIGPAFKQNYKVKPFTNIDLYPMFAKVQSLQLPRIRPNGSLENIQDVLRGNSGSYLPKKIIAKKNFVSAMLMLV